jgi:hypothetical protein
MAGKAGRHVRYVGKKAREGTKKQEKCEINPD